MIALASVPGFAGNQTSLLQRFLEPREIADLAVYLASPRSSATIQAPVSQIGNTTA